MLEKEKLFADVLNEALAAKVFPGCAFVYIEEGRSFSHGYGRFTYEVDSTAVTTESLYDCASLTKIIGPMAVAMQLIDEGVLDLEEKVGTYLPEFLNQPLKETALLAHVMTYTLNFDIPGGARAMMFNMPPNQVANSLLELPLKNSPGTDYVYTNLTAFLLTLIIEKVTGRKLAELVKERILLPLDMSSATFSPAPDIFSQIPPTEITKDRGEVKGFVHDEFSHFLIQGGISSGAAGLFVTIKDLQNFLQMTIDGGEYRGQKIFSQEVVSKWTKDYYPHLLPTHTPLCWGDTTNALIDRYHSEIVVKSGFTGCYLAADLKYKKGFTILSNRIYPQRPSDNSAMDQVRRKLMDIAFA